ncbi:MAG: DUF3187 family protein [Halioglobus sp.]
MAVRLTPFLLLAATFSVASEPLYVKNLSPVAGLLGLPSQREAEVSAAGSFDLALHGGIASHYVSESNDSEYLNFDGETVRLALEARYAIADNWDLQLEAPWLDHSGGNLDSLIDGWHDFWGMSDGGRSNVPRDLLDYRYLGSDDFSLQDDASGLGDITLALNHEFYSDERSSAAVVLGYKFGTGDEDEFLGSGADDVYVAVRFSGDHGNDLPLRWHGQLGYLHAGEIDFIQNMQERDLWFAGLGLDWRISPSWSLLGQLDGHAAPTDSSIDGLGEAAIMLSFGGRWRFAPQWALDLSIIEDVQVETAPDVTFQASLRYSGW